LVLYRADAKVISTTVQMDNKTSSVVGAEAGRLINQVSAKNDGVSRPVFDWRVLECDATLPLGR
jgi:hypothetical protein